MHVVCGYGIIYYIYYRQKMGDGDGGGFLVLIGIFHIL